MTDEWLDLPTIESGVKLTQERTRFKSMTKKLTGANRIWACDGEFVAFRRKKANPEALARHERFLASGDYKFIETQDDVEIYELMPSSPFKRKGELDIYAMRFFDLRREVVRAAVRRDWAIFIDGLEHLAGCIKGQHHGNPGTAGAQYNDLLIYVFNQIAMRGGPSQAEVDREVQALRRRRGARSSPVLLPAGISLQ
jgi:hypothetical protein